MYTTNIKNWLGIINNIITYCVKLSTKYIHDLVTGLS